MPHENFPKYDINPESKKIPEWITNEAHLINEALDKDTVTKEEAESGLFEDRELLDMMRKMVQVTYFVERPARDYETPEKRGEDLLNLFKQEITDAITGESQSLAEFLGENRQGVSLAMGSLDQKTAEAVRFLNEKNVPVVGWVVLDDLEGYWTNKTNIKETEAKTRAIQGWAKEHRLNLTALGFDIEKPLEYITALSRFNVREIIKQIRAYRKKVEERSKEADPEKQLEELIADLREEGVKTETYTMPRGTNKLLGGMNVETADRNIQMTYTSTLPPLLQKKGMKLMRSKKAISALGIVSGREGKIHEKDLLGVPLFLTQEELEHDIREVLDQELDFKNRKFNLRNLYLYTLNDARVALMMDQAMRTAFEKQES